jgi:hypothetical protein
MTRKRLLAAVMLGGVLMGAGVATKVARAGSVSNTDVTIFTIDGLDAAKGVLRAARNSSDSIQYIGCSRYAYDSGSDSIVCYAKDELNNYKSCHTGTDSMLRVAETLNPAAYLFFAVNSDGTCDRVITTLTSYNL